MKQFLINEIQKSLNKIYEKYDLNDELFDELFNIQVKVNKYKNKYNVNSKDELVYEKYTQ